MRTPSKPFTLLELVLVIGISAGVLYGLSKYYEARKANEATATAALPDQQLFCAWPGGTVNIPARTVKIIGDRVFELTSKTGEKLTFVAPTSAACGIGDVLAGTPRASTATPAAAPINPRLDL
jgi:hypothetical protein